MHVCDFCFYGLVPFYIAELGRLYASIKCIWSDSVIRLDTEREA